VQHSGERTNGDGAATGLPVPGRVRALNAARAQPRSLTFRFAGKLPPVPIGIDFDRQFCRIDGAPGQCINGFEADTLTERLFNVLLVAALAPREISIAEVQEIWGGKQLKSTLTRLTKVFKGGSLLELIRSRGNADSAHLRLNPSVILEYETTTLARHYLEDLLDRSSLVLPSTKQPVVVSSSVEDEDVGATLERFGYALSPASVESIRRAVALVTRHSADPYHALEIGIAAGAGVPIIADGELLHGIDLIGPIRDQRACVYDGSGDGTTVITALQRAQRPDAYPALHELTRLASKALRDGRPPRPATPLASHMTPACSIAEAARLQQHLARRALVNGRGIYRTWGLITTYADRDYKPDVDRLARRACGDSATEEDLLRAFCLARA